MINNKPYWDNREERATKAKVHVQTMEKLPRGESHIYQSIDCKNLGGEGIVPVDVQGSCPTREVKLSAKDTVSSLFSDVTSEMDSPVCILNFASYKNPGGAYLRGSSAQEESLCSESNLYNVLVEQEDFYKFNNEHLNRGLYMDRALYSKDVIFERAGRIKADVLTCASPNRSVLLKYGNFTEEENEEALRNRIKFIYSIMEMEGVKTAILGAYGCGVFRQNPVTVAEMFKEEIEKTSISHVIFAVPTGFHKENYEAFKSILG